MRKCQISAIPPSAVPSGQAWLDVDCTPFVEVTSEENGYPIDSALLGVEDRGWRAANSGTQTIRLIFDEPQQFKHIRFVFEESENTRTQEFVLRWSLNAGHSFREVVRQQWNFSSPDSLRETEDYAAELSDVTVLDLTFVPDKSGGAARASLVSLGLV
jgi:hypothetical protein